MELRQVRYFVAVAEELNFGRAATRLYMAQSPLSRQIRALEADLGVRLLERTTRSVTLTAAGRAFLGRARTLLADADELVRETRAADTRRPLHLAFDPCAGALRGPVLSVLGSRWPPDLLGAEDVENRADLLHALVSGQVDLVFGLDLAPRSADGVALVGSPLVALLPTHHHLEHRIALELSMLRRADSRPDVVMAAERLDAAFRSEGSERVSFLPATAPATPDRPTRAAPARRSRPDGSPRPATGRRTPASVRAIR